MLHFTRSWRRLAAFASRASSVACGLVVIGAASTLSLTASRSAAQVSLDLAASDVKAVGQWIVFTANERAQRNAPGGCDLDGDGDCSDEVLHVYDTLGGTTTVLSYAVRDFNVAGDFLAFAAYERRSGFQDFNGDTDENDVVLHVFDLTTAAGGTGSATNTGWAVRDFRMDPQHVVFSTPEGHQRASLNSDGDMRDAVVQVWDLTTDSLLENTGLESTFFRFAGDWIALRVSEAKQGQNLLNSDSDTSDRVLYLYRISTGTPTNVGIAVNGIEISPEGCIFTVPERHEAQTDLNGDGDIFDNVVEVYDFATSTLHPIDVSAKSLAISHTQAAFGADEFTHGFLGTDLNLDGDVLDEVVQIVDLATGTVTDLATQGRSLTPVDIDADSADDFVLFVTHETEDGDIDHNSDLDSTDFVLRAYDLSLGMTNDIAAATHVFHRQTDSIGKRRVTKDLYQVTGARVIFLTPEENEASTDLDGDLDTSDDVMQIHDLTGGTTTSTNLAASYYDVNGDLIGMATHESKQGGVDANADTDTSDYVVNTYDMSLGIPGTVTNVPIAVPFPRGINPSLSVGDSFVAYRARERSQGATDLNSDSDTRDTVVGFELP